jgi:hypothetical protein
MFVLLIITDLNLSPYKTDYRPFPKGPLWALGMTTSAPVERSRVGPEDFYHEAGRSVS